MDPEIDAIVLCAGSKGGEDEVGGLVLAVNIHLAGFDFGTHTVDVLLCGFRATVLDAGRKILQMMAQVVAVGAGLALVSSQIILSIINVYINKALSGMSTGASSAMAFLGLSGADVAISILIGALIARASMEAMNIGLKKITA
mgnify:CR=1 FL=1